MNRSRVWYGTIAAMVVVAGLASRRWPEWQPSLMAAYAGDVLWATLVFTLVALAFPRLSTVRVAATAASIAVIVEGSQLLHTPALDAFRMTREGALLLGQGFLWSDMVCYGLGVWLAALAERWGGRLR